jgi:hypothetical protein
VTLTAPLRQIDVPLAAADLSAVQQLACAVLTQAYKDATRPDGADLQARAFLLNGGELMRFWCAVAQLSPEIVGQGVRRRLRPVLRGRGRRDLVVRHVFAYDTPRGRRGTLLQPDPQTPTGASATLPR